MTFPCILIDPPWNETGGGKIKRGADRHYPLIKTRDIPGVIKSSGIWLPADNAHLWLWATNNKLPDALEVGAALGFEYKSSVAWIKMREGKVQIGIGQYLRGAHELLLFFVRGKGQSSDAWTGRRDVRSVIIAPRTAHSRKPVESYELVERVSKGPRVELFARSGREDWLSWGDELGGTGNDAEDYYTCGACGGSGGGDGPLKCLACGGRGEERRYDP